MKVCWSSFNMVAMEINLSQNDLTTSKSTSNLVDFKDGRQSQDLGKPREKWLSKGYWNRVVCEILVTMVTFCVGVVIGYSILYHKLNEKQEVVSLFSHVSETNHSFMQHKISKEKIEEYLKLFTSKPHLAGDEVKCNGISDDIQKLWQQYLGNDFVKTVPYYVMLSKPETPGFVVVRDVNRKVVFTSSKIEKARIHEEQQYRVPPYNAYSATGIAKGQLVYAHFGLMSDFLYLRNNNISVHGKILLMRYGKSFRANKVKLAEEYGAVAVILYTDPMDYSLGTVKYPDSWWLPEDGVQRGTVNHLDADPSTLGYPADNTDIYYKIDQKNLPQIQVQPISYGDALQLMRLLDGIVAPPKWQGKMNVTYRINTRPDNKNTFRVVVNVVNKPRSCICNVIARIPGNVEPDRVVMMGNHHDAWVFGGLDPSSGTAVLTEIVRVLGIGLKQGWKPRRTLMIASWDAEEFGLLGSTEWIEDNVPLVAAQMVAYLNVDSAIEGNFTLTAKSSSQLSNVLFTAASMVDDPDDPTRSLFDSWASKVPDSNNPGKPRVRIPASGSDFKTFINRYGVPVTDIRYDFDWDVVGKIASSPNYHSLHDTFYFVKNFVDNDFRYSSTVAQVWLMSALILTDDELLPFNFSDYSRTLHACSDGFTNNLSGDHKKEFEYVESSLKDFYAAVRQYEATIKKLEHMHDLLHVRSLNDQLMRVEKGFISSRGLDGRPYTRHVIYGPSRFNSYRGYCFPGLVDELLDIKYNGVQNDSDTKIRDNIALINYHIQQAAYVLNHTK